MELYLLVIYDISDDDLRNRVASFLKTMGLRRIQRSAFLGPTTPSLNREIEAGIRRLVRGYDGVNVQMFTLTKTCYNSRIVIGDFREPEDEIVLT
ncbi:MAG: CRISPR-associated endonuclease Cas2 [Crenarchaeota archaeon]|nr:CRISPR-associated endonuclease Cas2 [Thermoproteota archaeon]